MTRYRKIIYDLLILRQNLIYRLGCIHDALGHIGKDISVKEAFYYSLIPSRFQGTYLYDRLYELSDIRDTMIILLTISSVSGSILRYFIFRDESSPDFARLLLLIGIVAYILMAPFRFAENYELIKSKEKM